LCGHRELRIPKEYFLLPAKEADIADYVPRDLLTPAQRKVDGKYMNTLWIRTWFGERGNAASQAAADEGYRKLYQYTLRQDEPEEYDMWLVHKDFVYEYHTSGSDSADIRDGYVLATPWSTPSWLVDTFMRCPNQLSGKRALGMDY
jgi:hypothetical protein